MSKGRAGTRSATIIDVARQAGVSPSTVSNVLHARLSHVAPATVARVEAAIAALQYRPNHLARSLVQQASRTIGVVVTDIAAHPYPQAIKGIQEAAREAGYQVLLADTDRLADREQEALTTLRERRVDGVIIVSASGRGPSGHIASLAEEGFPFVLINRFVDNPAWPAIIIDNIQGVRQAVHHLAELGHRRIAYLGMPLSPSSLTKAAVEHLEGFRQGMEEIGVRPPEEWIRTVELGAEPQFTGAQQVAAEWLAEPPACRPTAVVTANDHMALGAIRAAVKLGLRVPQDLSVVGHDDLPVVRFFTPALTTVEQPMRAAGREAVAVLLARIGGKSDAVGKRLPGRLLVRESTGPVPVGP